MRARRGSALVAAGALALATLAGPPVGAEPAPDLADRVPVTQRDQEAVRPLLQEVPAAPVVPVTRGREVDPAAVRAAVTGHLASPWLGGRTSVTIRDAITGERILERNPNRPVTPASLTKILTAAAIVTALPMDETFDTTVVEGAGDGPDEIFLVSGGDMLLATGDGDPEAVVGRAGLGALARQVAQARGSNAPPVTLRIDPRYGAGEAAAPGWSDYWLDQGFTGPISMLGLAQDRAFPYRPAPRNPGQSAARAFHVALEDAGVEVTGEPDDGVRRGNAPADGRQLGSVSSAPAGDVLTLALADSDNAMIEQLARQAAIRAGVGTERADIHAWVIDQVAGYGVDVTGVRLADVAGLSAGTTIPVSVIGDLLVAGSDGEHPELQRVLGDLPIAGYSGTLYDRFHLDRHDPAVGVARAKTGSLPGVTSLAGTVVTREDRLLVYAIVADRIEDPAVLEARATTEDIVTALAECGC